MELKTQNIEMKRCEEEIMSWHREILEKSIMLLRDLFPGYNTRMEVWPQYARPRIYPFFFVLSLIWASTYPLENNMTTIDWYASSISANQWEFCK